MQNRSEKLCFRGCDGVTGYASSAGFGRGFTEGTRCKTKKNFNRGAVLGGTPGKLMRSTIVFTSARRGIDIKLYILMTKAAILFGNGINRISENSVSWSDLLKEVGGSASNYEKMPNTMIYEKILMHNLIKIKNLGDDSIRTIEEKIKSEISEKLKSQRGNTVYSKLTNLSETTNFLTTNYDDAFREGLDFPAKEKSEKIYSLRRKYEANDKKCVLWKIHGDMNAPKSIMLGLDHYCGSIAKIKSYIYGDYLFNTQKVMPIRDKLHNQNQFDSISWVELFFSHDIHIIGFSLDFSEIDIWWLLNKRARMLHDKDYPIHNKIYYYTNEENKEKLELLRSVNVEICKIPVEQNNYVSHYESAISAIQECITSRCT